MASLVPYLIACLLIASALLKSYSPAESAVLETAYEIPPWVVPLAVQLELFVAVWLISGRSQEAAKRATQALFLVFTAFSLYRALAGHESCGCFGSLQVNPWVTVALDSVVLLLLKLWAPKKRSASPQLNWSLTGYAALAIVCAWPLFQDPAASSDATDLPEASGLVILEPEEWIGKPFPLQPYLRPERQLDHGRWIVCLYHHDCPDCQAAKPLYEELAGHENVLLAEVPPYGPTADSNDHAARLIEDRKWFVQAPVEIQIVDGVVTSASLELPSIARNEDGQPHGG